MKLIKRRFDHLSRKEAIAILNELEGPLFEIILSCGSSDGASGDVLSWVLMGLETNPKLRPIFPSGDELDSWERFRRERGDDPKAIGEFVYGARANPWH